jgi:uncharacterized protein YbgA (DUF1722 family)/uncharacterized protein YbbK (DUF523 family)
VDKGKQSQRSSSGLAAAGANCPHPTARGEKIPIGISSCLLGERVRYDGGHKGHSYIVGTLGEYFDFKPFCPEMAIGLGVPRKPIRLYQGKDKVLRCVPSHDSGVDLTTKLEDCADGQRHWHALLCGYILKKDSPSCGMERVKVWGEESPVGNDSGVYARRLMQNMPWLPVEEEGRLGNAALRENFIQRVFVVHRWHQLLAEGLSVSGMVDFHARHKLILMSRDQLVCRRLGRLIASLDKSGLEAQAADYRDELMAALKIRVTRRNQVNVLQHIQGYLKRHLSPDDKQELRQVIESYRLGRLPLIVPITLLNHFFRKYPNDYIARSWYMNPYPGEMSLQNAI